MKTSPRYKLLLGVSFISVGAHATWPVKTIDLANGGNDCDTSREQYLHVEGFDFHDHPKFIMRWRQTSGPCGEAADEATLLSWEVSYDGSQELAEDDPPTEGDAGRVQLNLFVCAPFGEYELDLDIQSFSDEGSTLEQRTSWQINNGPDEDNVLHYPIWDTVNTDLAGDEDYSPTAPGEYTWPLEDAVGFYGTIIAGALGCASSVPSSTELVGCFNDSSTERLLNSDALVLEKRGPDGMTAQICSDFCSGYEYFGLEFGDECFCGTAGEFELNPVVSTQCDLSLSYLCTGDSSAACGGSNAISVYRRTSYSLVGCFQDDQASRIMEPKGSALFMFAEICYSRCNDGVNTHFGTQYGIECWCGINSDLTKHGEILPSGECDMLCAGTTSDQYCGGRYTMTAYEIQHQVPARPGYIGCYEDGLVRAMDEVGNHITGDMTNEACMSYCAIYGHAYAGTQYSIECWCGDAYQLYGRVSEDLCSYPCEGDTEQMCGGAYALSVYSTS